MEKLLVVDDDPALLELLQMHFEADSQLIVVTAQTGAEALARARDEAPDVIGLDMRLPDGSGLDFLPQLKRIAGEVPVIVATAHYDMETTIRAMKLGAFDYLHKPFTDISLLDQCIARALEARRASRREVPSVVEASARVGDIVGTSPRMQQVLKEIGRVAASRATVLITGESGTGKELIARVIHDYSDEEGRPFVGINCSAIVDTLLESELFGYERGAFTGANTTKIGKFESAEDGTLFLDEIGDMSLPLQAKLLRVLQEREFERVGGLKRIPLRARVVTATHRDLMAEVARGRFREDLFQRLKVMTIGLPPLRERRADIPPLVRHLLAKINEKMGKNVWMVSDEVMTHLTALPWKGNVRELENALTRAVVLAPGSALLKEHLPARDVAEPPRPGMGEAWTLETFPTLEVIEKAHVLEAVRLANGHKGRICALLGVSRPTLDRKLRQYQSEASANNDVSNRAQND